MRNERRPYEKHLADKLRQIPLPDPERSWEQMRQLLDQEMPQAGSAKRRGGWYWIGLLVLLIPGAWFTSDYLSAEKNEVARADNQKVIEGNSGSSQALSNKSSGINPPTTLKAQKNDDPAAPVENSLEAPQQNELDLPQPVISVTTTDRPPQKSSFFAAPNRNKVAGFTAAYAPEPQRQKKTSVEINSNEREPTAAHIGYTENLLAGIRTPDHIKYSPSKTLYLANSKSARTSRARSRTNLSLKKSFAAGLSMPLGLPLGDQNPLGYNINARANTLSDYLPAPHIQFHVNDKLYLQSELQFQAPQFIQPILLSENRIVTGNRVYTESIYARKLYYFNIPVGIHYSPFKNFYLGTGLQFSSLLSGIALFDERASAVGWPAADSVVSQRFFRFRNDSLSQKLNGSELRLGLDANYFWDRFTVGLRYNQALSNYVSIRLVGSPTLTQDKNKSLQVYLRYNLWDGRQPRQSSPK